MHQHELLIYLCSLLSKLLCFLRCRWPSVTAAAKKAYGLRYQLLSYIYSSLATVAAKGGTLARPLLFTDPSDLRARCVWLKLAKLKQNTGGYGLQTTVLEGHRPQRPARKVRSQP
jgi:hypothetical protein